MRPLRPDDPAELAAVRKELREIVRMLARAAAREDHERQEGSGKLAHRTGRNEPDLDER